MGTMNNLNNSEEEMPTTRHDFDYGFYGLIDAGDRTLWLFDSEGSFIGAYNSISQAAQTARRMGTL